MKTRLRKTFLRGYMLIEALVYISVVVVLLGLGYVAMYWCMNTSIQLRRSTEDISRALSVMERWRADVRRASVLRLDGTIVRMEGPAATNLYRFDGTNVLRSAGQSWTTVLSGLVASEMSPRHLNNAHGWQWNFELKSRTKTRIRPLFTATAVPAEKPNP